MPYRGICLSRSTPENGYWAAVEPAAFAAAANALPGVKQVVRRDKAYRPDPSFVVYVQSGDLETQGKVFDAELVVYQRFPDLYLDINIEELTSENSAAATSGVS